MNEFTEFQQRMQSSIIEAFAIPQRLLKRSFTMSEAITTDNLVLGRKYKETVLGREGVAISRIEYLSGCDRVELQWLNKDNEAKSLWIDITQLADVEVVNAKPGGPQDEPPSREPSF